MLLIQSDAIASLAFFVQEIDKRQTRGVMPDSGLFCRFLLYLSKISPTVLKVFFRDCKKKDKKSKKKSKKDGFFRGFPTKRRSKQGDYQFLGALLERLDDYFTFFIPQFLQKHLNCLEVFPQGSSLAPLFPISVKTL